jgi:hypothetical protein
MPISKSPTFGRLPVIALSREQLVAELWEYHTDTLNRLTFVEIRASKETGELQRWLSVRRSCAVDAWLAAAGAADPEEDDES